MQNKTHAVFGHGNQFSNYENYAILKGMDRTTLTDFFEEVETTEEYNGYFCSIAEAISIVVLGSLCGFKNVSQSISGRKVRTRANF